MQRIQLIEKITKNAARFALEVEGYNAANHYHINIHAENFLIPVLNTVFDLNLENLNASQKKNYPAIDLADFKNRVAFQITATATLDKIKDTISKFLANGLENDFDVLYVYVLTEKQTVYSQDKIDALTGDVMQFDVARHVIDKDGLLRCINAISATPKLAALAKIYEHEFSDVQIEMRQHKFEHGYLNPEPELVYPNLLEINFPTVFYQADVSIDKDGLIQEINAIRKHNGKRTYKTIRMEKLISRALYRQNARCNDWVLHGRSIMTFKNLRDLKEPLRYVVDVNTITTVESIHYAGTNDDTNRVFKNLLRNTLTELCQSRGIEWYHPRGIFRFANNQDMPNKKKVRWKGKKQSTKTVIFEMTNKKEGHIICFRSLAFKSAFYNFGDNWYLAVNPTWSFTNPGGYKTSRFESSYLSGIKRLENNQTVCNYVRFFGHYLSVTDLFDGGLAHLKIKPPQTMPFSPRLEEKKWRPVKMPIEQSDAPEVEMEVDTELDKTLFDE